MTRAWLISWFHRFWAVAGAVSVRSKIMGIVLGLVVALGLAITFQVRLALRQTMQRKLEEQSISVARDLAARATDLILINDLYGLHQLLAETRANNSDVSYAFIVGPEGEVLAHTFGEGFPDGLLLANQAQGSDHHRTVVLATDEGPIWDTAVPVFGGRAGTARVGLTESGLRRAVNAVTDQLLLTTALVSGLGIAAAAFLTWILTRPIRRLAQAAQAVGKGEFGQRVPRWAEDELGDLAEAFNDMAAALERAAEERQERERLRAEFVSGVIAAQEEERKRIARELHDSTSQALTSVLVGLRGLSEACPSDEVRHRAEELRSVASSTLEEVHNLALQLRPSVLDDLGLAAALERYVAECRTRYGLRIELAIRGLGEDRLPPPVETAVYRIAQEALTNVVRHSGATSASVLLDRQESTLLAIVEDDGKGFDLEADGPGGRRLGVYGMRERAELLGGRLTIESESGRGTSVYVSIPLPEGNAAHG